MRILLDNAILVRASGTTRGLARDLLLQIVESQHLLLLSNEMLYELAKVLRYPEMLTLHGLSEAQREGTSLKNILSSFLNRNITVTLPPERPPIKPLRLAENRPINRI